MRISDWSSDVCSSDLHTNPAGIIRDTAIQKVIMNSLGDGVMRELIRRNNGRDECCALVSEFYRAVQDVFRSEWKGHTPKTSRLVHGAGIVAPGYVLEELGGAPSGERGCQYA